MSHDVGDTSASLDGHHGSHHCSRSDIKHSSHRSKHSSPSHTQRHSKKRSQEIKKHKHGKHNKDRNKDSYKKSKKEKKRKKEKKQRKEKFENSPEASEKWSDKASEKSLSTMPVVQREPELKEHPIEAEKPMESEQMRSPASPSSHLNIVVGGFGTFGPPQRSSTFDPAATEKAYSATDSSSRVAEQARNCRDDKDRRMQSRRSRSRSRSRESRQRRKRDGKGRRSRSRSKSSDLSSEVSVRLRSGSGGRLRIDKQRLRRKALENTVMRLTERCPKKLAEMPCFKTLGVSVSELESICRRLAAHDRSADTAASTAPGDVAKDAKASEQPGQRWRQDKPSAGGVRHPFQLRPSSEAKSAFAASSSTSRFGQTSSSAAAVASQRKELLAAFPVSRGDFHSQVTVEPEVPVAPNGLIEHSFSSSSAAAARTEAFLAASCTTDSEVHNSGGVGSLHPSSHSASSPVPVVPPLGDWATVVQMQASNRLPGATQLQMQYQQQRANSPQAWVTKQQFLKAQPITGGIGHQLLEKMGWRSGQGLGRRNEGPVEPLAIDFKSDRKGLASSEDKLSNQQFSKKAKKAIAEALLRKTISSAAAAVGQPTPAQVRLGDPEQQLQLHRLLQPVNGKHPICLLMEFARQRKWPDPQFRLVQESGPQHERCFLICVKVCGTEYQPPWPSRSKKDAKTAAASLALQHLGLVPVV